MVLLALGDSKVFLGSKVMEDCQEKTERLDYKDHRAHREAQAGGEREDSLEKGALEDRMDRREAEVNRE